MKDYDVIFVDEDFVKTEFYDTRQMNVLKKDGTVLHTLRHTHFRGWPDWEVPAKGSMQDYQAMIKETAQFLK